MGPARGIKSKFKPQYRLRKRRLIPRRLIRRTYRKLARQQRQHFRAFVRVNTQHPFSPIFWKKRVKKIRYLVQRTNFATWVLILYGLVSISFKLFPHYPRKILAKYRAAKRREKDPKLAKKYKELLIKARVRKAVLKNRKRLGIISSSGRRLPSKNKKSSEMWTWKYKNKNKNDDDA